jgi:hypothetical protein
MEIFQHRFLLSVFRVFAIIWASEGRPIFWVRLPIGRCGGIQFSQIPPHFASVEALSSLVSAACKQVFVRCSRTRVCP